MEGKAVAQSVSDKQQLMQLIVFRIGDEEFGVPISAVQEIIKVGTITPIPDSPAFIKGLINVRGEIVAIIDVRARFFLSMDAEPSRHIIIARQDENLFGLLVNEVMEVLRIQESDIKSPPRLMTKIHEDYVHGVITHDGRLIILLDIQQVISEEELIKLADMSRSQQRKYGQIDLEDDDEKIIEERKIDLIAEKAKLAGDKKRKHRR
jgi:purine-binding chemotaxis protein CheW